MLHIISIRKCVKIEVRPLTTWLWCSYSPFPVGFHKLYYYLGMHSHKPVTSIQVYEMSVLFDIIQKRQLELSGERQLYCRLYDAGKWTNITGNFTHFASPCLLCHPLLLLKLSNQYHACLSKP